LSHLIFFLFLFLSNAGLTETDAQALKNIIERPLFFKSDLKPKFLKPEPKAVYTKTGEEILSTLLQFSSSAPKAKTEYIDSKNQMLEQWHQRHKKIAGVDR